MPEGRSRTCNGGRDQLARNSQSLV